MKEIIVRDKLKTEEEIRQAITDVARDLGVSLTEAMIERLIALMQKLAALDIDPDTIVEQAKGIFEKMKENGLDPAAYGVTEADEQGFWSVLAAMLKGFISWIQAFFG